MDDGVQQQTELSVRRLPPLAQNPRFNTSPAAPIIAWLPRIRFPGGVGIVFDFPRPAGEIVENLSDLMDPGRSLIITSLAGLNQTAQRPHGQRRFRMSTECNIDVLEREGGNGVVPRPLASAKARGKDALRVHPIGIEVSCETPQPLCCRGVARGPPAGPRRRST
jgi:hypothetical protein